MFKYTTDETVSFVKKKGPMTRSCISPHHTLTFGESLSALRYSWRFSDPHMNKREKNKINKETIFRKVQIFRLEIEII